TPDGLLQKGGPSPPRGRADTDRSTGVGTLTTETARCPGDRPCFAHGSVTPRTTRRVAATSAPAAGQRRIDPSCGHGPDWRFRDSYPAVASATRCRSDSDG